MVIQGHHSADSHCYLQYSQPYSPSFEITKRIDNLFTTIFCSHTMLTNGSPPKTMLIAPAGGLFGSQRCPEDNLESSDNNTGNTVSKDTQLGQSANQFHPPPGYSNPPSQSPSPGAPHISENKICFIKLSQLIVATNPRKLN